MTTTRLELTSMGVTTDVIAMNNENGGMLTAMDSPSENNAVMFTAIDKTGQSVRCSFYPIQARALSEWLTAWLKEHQ